MNKKHTQILDMPAIKNLIRNKHSKFLNDVGQIPIKITSDHQLNVVKFISKISCILQGFVEEKIIDKYVNVVDDNDVILPYSGFCLIKNSFDKMVYIWTDGNSIILKDENFLIKYGLETASYEHLHDINIETYNWVVFAETLLEYIHIVIYDRQKSYESALLGDLNE